MAAGMQEALHEYRDEATRKVREFSAIARGEGRFHIAWRKRKNLSTPALRLEEGDRAVVSSWRSRRDPVYPESEMWDWVRVSEDLTAGEKNIAPLEQPEGLNWDRAAGTDAP
jgi:hypothetical protein